MHFYTVINLNLCYSTPELLTTNLQETPTERNTTSSTSRDVSADNKQHQAEESNAGRDLNAEYKELQSTIRVFVNEGPR